MYVEAWMYVEASHPDPFVAKGKSQVTIDFDYKMNSRVISRKRLLEFSVTSFHLEPIFKN